MSKSKPKPAFSWDAIDNAQPRYDVPPEGARTLCDFMEAWKGMSRKGVWNRVDAMVRDGELMAGWRLRDGHRLRVYWPA